MKKNYLKDETSPYLLQHAENPVNWYPWGREAFERAKAEDKPVFLSIGYSTCHWCHVMAHESFEDTKTADILNEYFISVKVDKEERPDIDSVYMAVCQAFTGSGGWPMTILMTPDQKPFFAGTYFPKTARYGQIGLEELLLTVHEKWRTDREALLESAEEVLMHLKESTVSGDGAEERLISVSVDFYKQMFDKKFGGFGRAPKFPTPHNLLFLLTYYEKSGDEEVRNMAEKTLLQMYRGGMFDHIGGGFSRYSTDPYFLVPHFEKMLYDNALLILAYCRAYQITGEEVYCAVAEKTAAYILKEMTAPEGGFYSAQDADSEGTEGKYYLFAPDELTKLLGTEEGERFNQHFDITWEGNFEGKSIPNLLKTHTEDKNFATSLQTVYEYRKKRYFLHLDDKILTSWNALMIAAMCYLYRVSKKEIYLHAAVKAQKFIEEQLSENELLYVSFREGKRGARGFLDDYANEIFALLTLYETVFDKEYLKKARKFCDKVLSDFYDQQEGGFYLYGKENEQLILCPKETYDGAVPSGNSMMAYNLVFLYHLTGEEALGEMAKQQIHFLSAQAETYPTGSAMFLLALSDYLDPPEKITAVLKDRKDLQHLSCRIPLSAAVCVLEEATKEYPLKNNQTTFYRCKGHSCQPPVNDL